jgi:transposase InsO family protein
VRYAFIKEQHDWHKVTVMCGVLQVGRSGYYDWLKRPPSAREIEDQRLWPKILRVHHQRKEAYGAVKLSRELRGDGEICSKHRIARLKRENELWTKRHRRFVVTTKADAGHTRHPNLLHRNFTAEVPNRIWVADVTSVWTLEGWLYLAAILDLYSRRLIGWSMGVNCKDDLTVAALQMAIEIRRPKRGLIHHSDRGTHYASDRYQRILDQHGMRGSMSRTANCLDNAVAESFFSTLKNEETLHQRYATRTEARAAIFDYLEMFYNPVRQHSTCNGMSPVQFESANVRLTMCP